MCSISCRISRAGPDERSPDRIVVAAADLVGRHERVDLDQLVPGRDDRDLWRMGDRQRGVSAGRGHRDLPTGEADAPFHHHVAGLVVGTAAMDVAAVSRKFRGRQDGDQFALARRVLIGDHAIGALGKDRPRHDLDASLLTGQHEWPHSRRLRGLDLEFPYPLGGRCGTDGEPVHRDSVEGRQVAVSAQVASQDAPVRVGDAAVLLVE
jgi:hypothetical protein